MRTLTSTLKIAQTGASKTPAYEIECLAHTFDPEIASGLMGWGIFSLQKLYEGEDALLPHAVAMPSDGSLNRFKLNSGTAKLYQQRVASPTEASTYSGAWTELASAVTSIKTWSACASSASNNVYIFYTGLYDTTGEGNWMYELRYRKSTDGGATWGSATAIESAVGNPSYQIISACMTGADTVAIWITKGGSHTIKYGSVASLSSYSPAGITDTVITLAMVYDTALNIVMEVDTGGDAHRLAHAIFDPGVSWTAPEYMDNLSGASVNTFDLLTEEEQTWLDPNNLLSPDLPNYQTVYSPSRNNPDYIGQDTGFTRDIDQYYITKRIKGRAVRRVPITGWRDSVDEYGAIYPFLCKPTSAPAILSFGKTDTTPNQRWFYRVKNGQTLDNCTIIDDAWEYAYKQYLSDTYGMALACDSNYLWITNNNEVWRAPLPGKQFIPTTGTATNGSGAEEFAQNQILYIKEAVTEDGGVLNFIVDNYNGAYDSLPTTDISKGAKVTFKYGLVTSAGTEETYEKTYFLDRWEHGRADNRLYVSFTCVDAWYKLNNFTMPNDFFYNMISHDSTIYDIIEDMVKCIGGTLGYDSRSTELTSTYPHLKISAGETAASIIKKLLEGVDDVIQFDGLVGTIINIQSTDTAVYNYEFPEVT